MCVCAEEHERFFPPPPPLPKTYVQGALRPMTGDQGAVLLCVQRNMNAFVPPRPCPRLLLEMTGDQGAVLLCVQRNMNAFVSPPAPAQDYCFR